MKVLNRLIFISLIQFFLVFSVMASIDVRGLGPNLGGPPLNGDPMYPVFASCTLFKSNGVAAGTITSYINLNSSDPNTHQPTLASHIINIDGGSLTITNMPLGTDFSLGPLPITSPQGAAFAAAFPDIQKIIATIPNYDPNKAAMLFAMGNHNNPNDGSWVGTGNLSKVNYLEIRCAYFVYNGVIVQCLGCHYFLGTDD